MSKVMAEVGAIPKSRQMAAGPQKYAYRGIEDLLPVVQPLFSKYGITFWPRISDWSTDDAGTSQSGTVKQETRLKVEWTVVGPAGDERQVEIPSQAIDTGDKGVAKAMTQSRKLLIEALLFPPTEESNDPDHDSPQRGRERQRALQTESSVGVGAGGAVWKGSDWAAVKDLQRRVDAMSGTPAYNGLAVELANRYDRPVVTQLAQLGPEELANLTEIVAAAEMAAKN